MSEEYDVGPFKKIFKSYHNCHETPAIVHGNGDSMIYEYWKDSKLRKFELRDKASISSMLYTRVFCTKVLSYFYQSQNVTTEKVPKRLSYKKRVCKTLMKLTAGKGN